MASTNLRNQPIDQRRLSAQDRETYQAANPGGGRRTQALKRARAYRGNLAYQRNKPVRTTQRKPGSGGFNPGIELQQQRQAERGAEQRRQAGFRPERLKSTEDPLF